MPGVLTPDEVIQRLSLGNERWVSGQLRHPHQAPARRFATSVHGQNPVAAVLACSDSRTCPEQLMDVGLGDLFTIRVAGNVLSPAVISSLEFAALELEIPLFVVLGHTGCGAVNAFLQGGDFPPEMAPVMDLVGLAVDEARGRAPDLGLEDLADTASEINARRVAAELPLRCPGVRALAASGRSRVVAAMYRLRSGELDWLD